MVYQKEDGREYHIGTRKEDVGRYVILPGDPKRTAKIAAYLEDAKLVADQREFMTYTGYLEGEKVSVTSTGIGGPSAAIALEELVHCGADTFVRTGTCGAIRMDIMGGDLVIATGAVRAEGTSREYAPIEYPAVADYKIVQALAQAAETTGAHAHIGVVQSKDSFYGEHEPETKAVSHELLAKWDAWKKMGCLASEMESAALFIVGAYLGVKVGACYLVMGNQERQAAGFDNPIAYDTDLAVRTAVEAVRNMILRSRI